jgi:anhydro-N-acetylmuramic acid kinase
MVHGVKDTEDRVMNAKMDEMENQRGAMVRVIERLRALSEKSSRIVAGVMSGTSVDAIDVGVCRITGAGLPCDGRPGAKVELLYHHAHPYDAGVRDRVRRSAAASTAEIAELTVLIGQQFADAILGAQQACPQTPIDLVGSHGQTVYHHSTVPGRMRATLQLGCGDTIAYMTGLPVISNFRAKDVAAGGEGAPLTPYADMVLFGSGTQPTAVLNMGGIANITFLADGGAPVVGFDSGPANAPLDRLARIISGGALEWDQDGAIARSGILNVTLLKTLLADPYLAKPPPKSTGFERYGDQFVSDVISQHGAADANLLRTVTEFVARSISDALRQFAPKPVERVIVAGGGVKNQFLAELLAGQLGLDCPLIDPTEFGVPPQSREAMAFALFANDWLFGLPTSLPSVTGASRPVSLGMLSLP